MSAHNWTAVGPYADALASLISPTPRLDLPTLIALASHVVRGAAGGTAPLLWAVRGDFTIPLAQTLSDSLAKGLYTLSKEVHSLPFPSDFGGYDSTIERGDGPQFSSG